MDVADNCALRVDESFGTDFRGIYGLLKLVSTLALILVGFSVALELLEQPLAIKDTTIIAITARKYSFLVLNLSTSFR